MYFFLFQLLPAQNVPLVCILTQDLHLVLRVREDISVGEVAHPLLHLTVYVHREVGVMVTITDRVKLGHTTSSPNQLTCQPAPYVLQVNRKFFPL